MNQAKRFIIQRRLKAKRKRQRIQAVIQALGKQAGAEARVFGQPLPATLKKIQHRKHKLTQL